MNKKQFALNHYKLFNLICRNKFKGKIDINVDGEHFYVQENEFFVIESKLLHSIYTLEDCHYYTCVFKKEILDFSFKDYITSKYIHPYIVDELVVNEIIKCDHTSINDFYLQILRCCNEKNLGYQLFIKVSLLNIFNFASFPISKSFSVTDIPPVYTLLEAVFSSIPIFPILNISNSKRIIIITTNI